MAILQLPTVDPRRRKGVAMQPTLVERGPAETHTEPRPLAVVARRVRKAYGDTRALAGVDLSISRGEVFGLLGPNGAGKTTLVEILEGHRTRDEGEVAVFGFDPQTRGRGLRERIRGGPQEGQHIPTMKVGEAVRLFSAAYPHPLDPSGVLELVELADRANDRIGPPSGCARRGLGPAGGVGGGPAPT